MVQGLNSDFYLDGKHYHLQTEDWGLDKPFLVTRLYCQGAVLKTLKRSYVDIFGTTRISSDVLKVALKHQHEGFAKDFISTKK
ncbi:MAG: hypothetical protein ACK5V3_05400 [Bdellovibrionales bacterium]